VKQGAENMIESFSKGNSKDKKMLAEAQQMLADSKAKIEYLKMRMAKMKQCSRTADAISNNGEQLHKGSVFLFYSRQCCYSNSCALLSHRKHNQLWFGGSGAGTAPPTPDRGGGR
jgi:Hr1 repeat